MRFTITLFLLGTFFVPIFSQSTISTCGGVINTSGSTISYKLFDLISKNERCVWTVRVANAATYTLNVVRMGSWDGREVTGACISIDSEGKTEVYQYGILDSKGPKELRNPCHILVITLYSGEETSDGKGFSMRITATTGSSRVSSNSRQMVVNHEEGAIQHPPTGRSEYSDNEISTFIFIPPTNFYNSKRVTLVTFVMNSLEGTSCYDYVLVYKLRTKDRDSSWEGSQSKDVDKICGDTSYKLWASDDVIMVIFRSDGSNSNAGFSILHADLPM
ncbi:Procollagen C-endopeptidase enhancer 1 [Orchesella cincta]|uniref:Procollagen C-endopeptidase enhancer 1 n=1 Tax=Orchesella cincta TaxID=48709 RepID=A0A1D2M9I7_ORCCI|nr:Procollagen C-endopeptidase enhancer 1 [Orchesella cincta]